MNKRLAYLLLNLLLSGTCLPLTISAQISPLINPALLNNKWSARWITCPAAPQREYGVYHFRKEISIETVPANFIVHVTADNRYRLFVNGVAVSSGPARGDLYNWYYATLNIAPYLHPGKNTIAALVWNMGTLAPVAQISQQTGFLLQGNSDIEKSVNTNASWKVLSNEAYHPCSVDNASRLRTYMVIGPGDSLQADKYPWGWEQLSYNDQGWQNAAVLTGPSSFQYGTDNLWTLQPSIIPAMYEQRKNISQIRRVGVKEQSLVLDAENPFTVPANTTVSILLDQGENTVAYPELRLKNGKAASIKVTYAEALMNAAGEKGYRNEIAGKQITGNYDVWVTDGADRTFRPLWMRTYRYVQLDIVTKEDALVIADFYGQATGYPLEEKAKFSSNDASLQNIWQVGWRTARLCAGETYFDCPYYEQLQYEGDTRIQSLISLYVSGDDRLMRKAILDFYHSRVPEGLTQGRYPSNRLQVIPPFSLYWISMLYDYTMYRNDSAFIEPFLIPTTAILNWYEKRIDQKKNMLGPMKWWNFTDWDLTFPSGTPPGATDGNSSIVTLQYVYTLDQAAALFTYFRQTAMAEKYKAIANRLRRSVYQLCFDHTRGVMANTPDKNSYSQHASIMGVLTGSVPGEKSASVMQRVLSDQGLSQATFYYRFYLNLALQKAGMGDLYYSQLKPWRDMITNGLTTFAENPDPTRSDCHAWSASPNYDFLATLCGVKPAAPGFRRVMIEPHLGELTEVRGEIPHPAGVIRVQFNRKGGEGIHGSIDLPAGITGVFFWGGKMRQLVSGSQTIDW
ncbi:MAG: family 78 glycoside hydrolase catalytic domain [Bacteroidetes bacterium]|nr:family 78 glycoside hydrolase catalytic domain [Bacteroidota bacterium]